MFDPPLLLPTTAETVDDAGDPADLGELALTFARALGRLLGPAYNGADGNVHGDDLLAWGWALAEAHDRQTNVANNAIPSTATADTLDMWEARLGVPTDPGATLATRRANVVAKRRAAGNASAARLLSIAQAIDPTATLHTNPAVDVAANNPRAVSLFAIKVATSVWDDPVQLATLRKALLAAKRAHTHFNLPTRIGFRCDDPLSLCDRDVLDA